jgi:hypothetical protein
VGQVEGEQRERKWNKVESVEKESYDYNQIKPEQDGVSRAALDLHRLCLQVR